MIWQEEQRNFRNQSSNLLIFIRQFWDLGKKWPGLSSAALSELFILFLFFLLFLLQLPLTFTRLNCLLNLFSIRMKQIVYYLSLKKGKTILIFFKADTILVL